MTANRCWPGYGILLLATVGLLLCLGGIAGAWWVKGRVDAAGATAFLAVDEALGFIEAKLNLVKQGLERSRQSVGELTRRVEQLQSAEPDIPLICQASLQTIETIRQEFQSTATWLESGFAIANGIQRISTAILSSALAAAQPNATGFTLARDVQAVAVTATDSLTRLQALRGNLIELQDMEFPTRELTRPLLERVAELDGVIIRLGERIEHVDVQAAGFRAVCAEQAQVFRGWTRLAAIIASLLPAWFGLFQIVVMVWGLRIAHPRPNPPSAHGCG